MEVFRTVASLQEFVAKRKKMGSVGFVPTMGALHEGHLSLVAQARQSNGCVVVSVFVNPTQFNDPRDLDSYPRTESADLALLESAGVDAVFVPSVEAIYPEPDERNFDFGAIERVMEGASRPGHFNGVAQVVSRLFDIVTPQQAYFGEKDFQQLAIIRLMVRTLGYTDIQIVGCPIIRAGDGLALSSRNALLSEQQRAAAPEVHRALSKIVEAMDGQGVKDTARLRRLASDMINSHEHLKVEYIEMVDPETLQSVDNVEQGQRVRICAAVRCGAVRLIDNVEGINIVESV